MMKTATLAATALALVLGACGGQPPAHRLSTEAHPIVVREARAVLELPIARDQFALTRSDTAQIRAFALEHQVRGHGPLTIATPAGGANHGAVVGATAEARRILSDAGLPYAQIEGARYDAAGAADAPLVFMFTRYEAEAPTCFERWDDYAHAGAGRNTLNFGCANAANLAAMIVDPRDLVTPRAMDAPDRTRRTIVLEKYRQGETTATERSDAEQASVSDAVN